MSKFPIGYKELIVDAGHYWERMRIPYNLVLATLALSCWGSEMLSGQARDLIAAMIVLVVFAIAANLCFCSAYPVDVAFQLTPMRRYRHFARWTLFVCGMFFASACAVWVLLGDHMA